MVSGQPKKKFWDGSLTVPQGALTFWQIKLKKMKSLKELTCQATIWIGDLEKINGKLMHTTIGIPNGHGLLSPLIATITAQPKTRHYKDRKIRINAATQQSLTNWKTLLPVALQDPTPCSDLVPALADFGGYLRCVKRRCWRSVVWFE